MYEIYLSKKNLTLDDWRSLIDILFGLKMKPNKMTITTTFTNREVHYFLHTDLSLPTILNGASNFTLKKTDKQKNIRSTISLPRMVSTEDSSLDIYTKFQTKYHETLEYLQIDFLTLTEDTRLYKVKGIVSKRGNNYKRRLIFSSPYNLLAINFKENPNFIMKGTPKYLDISKNLDMLKKSSSSAFLKVDTFPYRDDESYLEIDSFSYDSHSLVLGSSGSGKSKFLSILTTHILSDSRNSKVVIIDPHANLENDIGGLGKVIDFLSPSSSLDIFKSSTDEPLIETEMSTELLKSLIGPAYNAKLERVLRHSLYILLASSSLSWANLRRLLLDVEYRTNIVNAEKKRVPKSIVDFFMMDFNDIKTKSYGEAIAPIISFVDEMELLPALNDSSNESIEDIISENRMTLFSLDESSLGHKMTRTLAGLIMQKIFMLASSHKIDGHLTFIIDEVPTIENPILRRFLSEARKYDVNVIIAGQYFGQISAPLKSAIFANTVNYYLFRVSKEDANTLVDNIDMKIPLEDTKEAKISLLTGLKDRCLIARLARGGNLLQPFKCETLDFESTPRPKEDQSVIETPTRDKTCQSNFEIDTNVSLKELMKKTSTSRKVVK